VGADSNSRRRLLLPDTCSDAAPARVPHSAIAFVPGAASLLAIAKATLQSSGSDCSLAGDAVRNANYRAPSEAKRRRGLGLFGTRCSCVGTLSAVARAPRPVLILGVTGAIDERQQHKTHGRARDDADWSPGERQHGASDL